MKTKILWGLVLGSLMVGSAGAVRLRYNDQPGTKVSYKVGLAATGIIYALDTQIPLQFKGTSGYEYEVVSVSPQGHITTRIRTLPFQVQSNNQPLPPNALPQIPPLLVTIDRQGKVLRVRAEGTAPPSTLPAGLSFKYDDVLSQMSSLTFPQRDLKVGDTWENTVTVSLPRGGSLRVTARSKLEGFQTVAGRRCAVIRTQVTLPLTLAFGIAGQQAQQAVPLTGKTTGRMTGEIVSYFSLEEGLLQQSASEMRLEMTMSGPSGGPGSRPVSVRAVATVRTHITRQPAAPEGG
ncbi:MAG TPA: hypothetical protein EYP85_08045 [Armatimonadetes bacterium]|nr:hypothetical protein [Armatimonadota bacterium]